ncbi:MAG: CDP-diacylglycerol--serine O-phosphatidyltransferase [Rikenellaceae bacterium]
MKIKLFTIPNILTLSNLFCGSVALIEVFLYQNFFAAFMLILLSATFDFLDGMSARLLGQYSAIGRELDSLADVVSFGLAPAMVMFTLFNLAERSIENPIWGKYGAFIPLLIVCFSALRLAKFNVDAEQESSFIGLPTPANALFCFSLAVLVEGGRIVVSAEVIALISVVMALLLIAPLKFFALKFKNLSWRDNRVRYIFLLLVVVIVALLREFAIPAIIVLYIVMSAAGNLLCRSTSQNRVKNE